MSEQTDYFVDTSGEAKVVAPTSPEESADVSKEENGDSARNSQNKKSKRVRKTTGAHTLFVGQLPFYATQESILEHFESFGVLGASVRLLTNKKTGKSKGIAFLEVTSDKQVATALRAHHTLLGNRQINVERTVGGGGNGKARREKLKSLRQLQGTAFLQEIRALVDEAIEKSDGAIERADIDDRLVEALCNFPRKAAKLILEEVSQSDFSTVRNKSAWIMGFIKRYRDKMQAKEDFSDADAGKYKDRKDKRRRDRSRGQGSSKRGRDSGDRDRHAKRHKSTPPQPAVEGWRGGGR